jgi:hypothetical protein
MQGAGLAPRDTFSVVISEAKTERDMFHWFETAEPGARIWYCRGAVPLRLSASWKLAGVWQAAGLVHLVTERKGNITTYFAEKRPIGTAPVLAVKRSFVEDLNQVQLDALLGLLRDAAAAGLPCPSGTALARAVTGQTDQRARNRVVHLRKRLVAEGKIAVAAGTHARKPVVTILARGKGCGMSTALTVLEGGVA